MMMTMVERRRRRVGGGVRRMSRFVMQMKQINQFQREKSKNIDFSAPVTIITGRVERKKTGRPTPEPRAALI